MTGLASHVRDVVDYPKPGIVFKDLTPLFADAGAFGAAVEALAEGAPAFDKVAGIEARGFVVAAPVAARAGTGFVPIRKAGKLPAATYATSYALEYGEATIEVHRDAFVPGERVLVVDDVLATGGTAAAAVRLVREAGAEVAGVAVVVELAFLGGRARLEGLPLLALLTY